MASTRVTGLATCVAVSVDATAELVLAANTSRTSCVIQNADATDIVYIGPTSGVLTTNGLKIAAGASVTIDDYLGEIWGIGSAAAVDVRVWETK